jgi:hypothetical protein
MLRLTVLAVELFGGSFEVNPARIPSASIWDSLAC